jgi:hypothetical protein
MLIGSRRVGPDTAPGHDGSGDDEVHANGGCCDGIEEAEGNSVRPEMQENLGVVESDDGPTAGVAAADEAPTTPVASGKRVGFSGATPPPCAAAHGSSR